MFRRPKRQRETVDLQFDNGNLTHLAHGGDTHVVASPATVAANTAAIATNASGVSTNQSNLSTLESTVTSNTTSLTSLQSTVASNTTAIDDKITSIQESGGTMTRMTIDGNEYTLGGGASTLGELTDVSVSNPSDGQALVYSTNQWVPGTAGTSVTANPSTTPTTDLTKVTIGSTDYNVGQQDSIVHEEGTVQVKFTGGYDHAGSLTEPDPNDTYPNATSDTFTMQYVRVGSHVDLIGSFSLEIASTSSGQISGNLDCEFVSPPSWLILQSDPTYATELSDHGSTFVVGQVTTSRPIHGQGITGDVRVLGNTSFRICYAIFMWTNTDPSRMSLHMRCKLPSSSGSPYYRIPSLRANHAYQQRDEQHKIDIPARSGTNPQWTAITDGTNEFSVTITPSSVNAKIELDAIVAFSQARDGDLNDDTETSKKLFTVFAFKRGSTTLLPSASGNRTGTLAGGDYNDLDWPAAMHTTELRYFDEPGTTSPVTYTVVVGNRHTSTIDFQWNRSPASNDDGYFYDGLSTFSAQEIDAAPQLSNVSTTGAQADQTLVYNSSNQWVPGTAGGFSCQIFRVTSNQTVTGSDTLIDDYAVPNNALHANFGSYVSVSSGIFSFSKTGFYRVDLTILGSNGNSTSNNHHNGYILTSNNGGATYDASARAITQEGAGGDSASTSAVLSITDLANSKVKVEYYNTAGRIDGSSSQTKSFIMFSRIGDA